MSPKQRLSTFIFIFLIGLAACTPAMTPTVEPSIVTVTPTAITATEAPPTNTPESLSEAARLVQQYYEALNRQDLDTAMSFIAADAVFINPTGSYTGAEEIRASLEAQFRDGITFELSNYRDTDGRVVYDYKVLIGGEVVETGTNGLTIVKDGLIVFDGTEGTENTAQILMAPDPITVVQTYYAAYNARELDTIAALLDENIRWRGTPYLTGKSSVLTYLQGDFNTGFTTEIRDLRETKGRVTYTWTAYREQAFQASGEDTMVVENGKIVAIESFAFLGSDSRPEMTEIVFSASDTAFTGPTEIAGGWVKLVLNNEGQEPHHLQLVKLFDGKTAEELKTALSADPENFPSWSQPYGGPNAPDPGGVTSAIVFLDAGPYVLIDVIPNAEGTPHFLTGLMSPLTVTKPKGTIAGEPLADITINLTEFAFLVSGNLTPGEHMIRFNNAGKQVHEAFLVKLNEGATAEDYLNTPPGNIPPAISLGGVTGISPEDGQYIPVTLESGEYALFCFFPDPGTHAPHFVQGMVIQFSVK